MMKKCMLFLMSFCLVAGVKAQQVTLNFTGSFATGEYACMDSVVVENLSQNWTEVLVYPDTVFTFSDVSIKEADCELQLQAYPNPSRGVANVMLQTDKSEQVSIQLFNLSGQILAEYSGALDAGSHLFKVQMSGTQVFMLAARTSKGTQVLKLANTGNGGSNAIILQGRQNMHKSLQYNSEHTFTAGDEMRYTGYITCEEEVLISDSIQQVQAGSENIVLMFTMPKKKIAFSLNDTTQVLFAPGNLQYKASTNTWRFAIHQYDYVGGYVNSSNHGFVGMWGNVYEDTMRCNNCNIDQNYGGWIDLLGWGTSGYNGKNPYMRSTSNTQYGDGLNDITGTNYDWGLYNNIYNTQTGTIDSAGIWRSLTTYEWQYLLGDTGATRGGLHPDWWIFNMVNITIDSVNEVFGMIVYPDKWTKAPQTDSVLTRNNNIPVTISKAEFEQLEALGCVFLPEGGHRYGTDFYNWTHVGDYWSTTHNDSQFAFGLTFNNEGVIDAKYIFHHRNYGMSVRMVKKIE